ncbi:2-succinyl-5-enolpyruvyl-6-hydroxy-3-cyclohexene-1-carboxylic-acid synthase [Pendulispora rubella]|uniref:2-succinyl-5-enolpyruvyl-6-hydroxy-3-cyclohexene-1-carboxylate synthase n=1 Tax=Pendulispora rubella TaxID=2741070 RepID=A0ABZ2KU13_9BACT
MNEATVLTEWARLLMRSLADAGISDVVLSPGSRSTPYLIAALRESRFRCHDAIDERAAAFFALGQARWTSRPSLVLCTSGTAAAHYYPAIVEASLARVPLVVVTADRPFELQDCAASQTIDQTKMYGHYVRLFLETGMPDSAPEALHALQRMAAQSVFAAHWPDPGPVHLNVRARKPLEPQAPRTESERELARALRSMRPAPAVSVPRVRPEAAAIGAAVQQCREARAGLLVCGPLPIDASGARAALLDLAEATQFPLLAEVTSQLRLMNADAARAPALCDAFDRVLASKPFREAHAPDLIVQIGGTPTSGAWERYSSAHRRTPRIVLAEHGWTDASNAASTMLFGAIAETAAAMADGLRGTPPAASGAWTKDFVDASREAWIAVDAEIREEVLGPLTERGAVRTVLERLRPGSVLMLANSLPIRHVESLARTGMADVAVACQRGANGIDGQMAGALGTAMASNRPTTLLVGDIGFLHDLNSLMLAMRATVPVVLVVLNNGGGRIFERLPIATEAHVHGVTPEELAHVTTPHALEFGQAARMFGLAYRCVESARDLDDALSKAYAHPACTVIECRTPRPRKDGS